MIHPGRQATNSARITTPLSFISIREALRCIFWCLRGTQSTRIGQTLVDHPVGFEFVYIVAFSRSSFATEQFQRNLFTYIAR